MSLDLGFPTNNTGSIPAVRRDLQREGTEVMDAGHRERRTFGGDEGRQRVDGSRCRKRGSAVPHDRAGPGSCPT